MTTAQETINAFVIAAHADLPKVRRMLHEDPALLRSNAAWTETPIQAAAHTGNQEIVRFLLSQGVEPSIFTATVLGATDEVARFLDGHPELVRARGAHGIPLLFHAVAAGQQAVCELLVQRGTDVNDGSGGNTALHAAALFGPTSIAMWLLAQGADPNVIDYEQKTPLDRAVAAGHSDVADLLRRHGGRTTG